MGFATFDTYIEILSDAVDMPFNLINLFVLMILTLPLGFLCRFIRNYYLRLFYGLIIGLLIQYQMYGISMLHLIVATINTYLFIKYLGRKYSAFYVMIFNILHLSCIHISNMIANYGSWTLGVETLYMMSICKFSSIAFNYDDGGKEESVIKSSYQRAKLVKDKPTLLEIFSFIFFFPSALIGPSFEFSDFIKYIKFEKEYKNINWSACYKAAFSQFVQGLLCTVVLIFAGKTFNTYYCGTEEHEDRSMPFKFFYFIISMTVLRSKYYVGWKISQASVIISGLGYDSNLNEKGESIPNFEKIENCNLVKIELSLNPRVRINYWNRTVHLWLKYYIFLRLINVEKKPFKNNKSLASLLTFMISAFWHGFYPGYFLFFFEYYMIEQITKYLDEEFDLFNEISKSSVFIQIVSGIVITATLDYFGVCFSLLTPRENYIFSRAFYFVPFMSLFGSYLYTLLARIHHKKKLRVQPEKEGSKMRTKEE